jgi:hypothetical protein
MYEIIPVDQFCIICRTDASWWPFNDTNGCQLTEQPWNEVAFALWNELYSPSNQRRTETGLNGLHHMNGSYAGRYLFIVWGKNKA